VQFLIESGDVLLEGFLGTLRMLALTFVLAVPLGIVLAGMRISPVPSLRWVAAGFTELLRNTPLTLVFFLLVFVVPSTPRRSAPASTRCRWVRPKRPDRSA